LYDTEGVAATGPGMVEVGRLASDEKRTLTFGVRLRGPQPDRQNKFMVAAKATWKPLPEPKTTDDTPKIGSLRPPKQCVAFEYVQGV